ncbi:MAG: 3-keto-disaccharide hydrolase [Opitutales bacterium]
MKWIALLAAGIIASLTACQTAQQALEASAPDLDDYTYVLVDETFTKEDVWTVEDGVLICKGKPLGYLQTKASYEDFKLSFEWRWPVGKPGGNSGVLFRIQGEANGFMPQCVEAQLKSGSAGDLWAFFGAKVAGERPVDVKDHDPLGDFHGVKAEKNAERPIGEWNRYEITVKGEKVDLKINGERVNQGSALLRKAGPIGFQSEGGEIHFRKIRITRI